MEEDPAKLIQTNLDKIRQFGARKIGIFGSFAEGTASENSDVDIYVEFEEEKRTYDNFFGLHETLENLLQRRIDLITDKSLSESKARLILPKVHYVS